MVGFRANKPPARCVPRSEHIKIMKTKILTVTATLATLAALASPAHASNRSDKVAAAIGGFIGGVIVGSHLDRHDHGPAPVVVCPPEPKVVVVSGHSHGHWETVSTRVWVPARWVVTVDSYGRRVRSRVGGCYETRMERVWVEHGHGRGDRVVVARGPGRY